MKKLQKNQNKSLEEAIIELYLNVKIRKQDEVKLIITQIENYDTNAQEKEKENLRKASPFTIIEYIKSSIEILIDIKVKEQLQERENRINDTYNPDEEEVNEYEKLLRKLESDIRIHIKVCN